MENSWTRLWNVVTKGLIIISIWSTFGAAQTDPHSLGANQLTAFASQSFSTRDSPTRNEVPPIGERRRSFFPPPDRHSPTLRPILPLPGAPISQTTPASSSLPPKDYDDLDYYNYYDDYYYYLVDGNGTEVLPQSNAAAAPVQPNSFSRPSLTTARDISNTPRPTSSIQPIISSHSPFRFRFTPAHGGVSTPRPFTIPTTRPSGRPKLAELLARLEKNSGATENPSLNDVDSSRRGRVFGPPHSSVVSVTTHNDAISPARVQFRITNSTESTFVVSSVESSHSIKVDDNKSTQSFGTTPLAPTLSSTPEYFDSLSVDYFDYTTPEVVYEYDITTEKQSSQRLDGRGFSPLPASQNLPQGPSITKSSSKTDFSSLFATAEVASDPSLLPPGFSEEASKQTVKPKTVSLFDSLPKTDLSAFLPPGFKPELQEPTPEKPEPPKSSITYVNPSAFLPLGYNEETNEPEAANPALPKPSITFVDPSSFLPPGFKPLEEDKLKTKNDPVPFGGLAVKTVDASAFLPPGYKPSSKPETTTELSSTTRKVVNGLIFPKAKNWPSFVTTSTTTQKPVDSEFPVVKPKIFNIFDKFKNQPTTEYVVPIITESPKVKAAMEAEKKKKLEERTTSTTTSTSTTTTTTTTLRPTRPTTPGVCGTNCRLAASLRLVDGVDWRSELFARETPEFQTLANDIANELDAFYRSSSLNLWYDYVEVDSFYKGSVIASYILQLNEVKDDIDTQDLKDRVNRELGESGFRLGNYTVDPRGTDFEVRQERRSHGTLDRGQYVVPEWLIAVIVIGLASVAFVLIFGVTILVSRARTRKRASPPLTEEYLNKLNASQPHSGTDDSFVIDGVNYFDLDDIWNDRIANEKAMKPPSSRGQGYNPNYNININDSWRTDFSEQDESTATYSKRRPELTYGRWERTPPYHSNEDPYDF